MDLKGVFFNTEDFELQRIKIGEGGYGSVYLSKHKKEGKLYATKIIKVHENFNGQDQMRLMQESIIHQNLHHPAIVVFKGVNFLSFTDPTNFSPSIITEYMKNGSLRNILKQEMHALADFNWDSTKKLITLLGISNAMKYLHQQGIIHRDLKPENVLEDDNFYPRICDFGFSRCLPKQLKKSEQANMTGKIGTPIYMAPELLRGDNNYDETIDVYAFAMIAYEIVTGKVPFCELTNDGMNAIALGIKITEGYRPPIGDDVPEKMRNLIFRCWSENSKERPSFSEIFDELSNDFSCLGMPVNEVEVQDYLDSIEEYEGDEEGEKNIPNEIEDLKHEVNELKRQLNCYTASNEKFIFALHLMHGNTIERDVNLAIEELKLVSDGGNSYASYLLGLHYSNDKSDEKDFIKAKKYFERTTEQGNSAGFNGIGFVYKHGYGVERDYHKAKEYYERSAKLGNSNALINIADLYEKGNGVDKNSQKAKEYYEQSAKLGNSYALIKLGFYYENGGFDSNIFFSFNNKDYHKAKEYYEQSAELGNSTALNRLGLLYYNGHGVEKDYHKAKEFFERSAELGNTYALNNLGDLYENGNGVDKDYQKAKDYYERSSKYGNSEASDKLKLLLKKIQDKK